VADDYVRQGQTFRAEEFSSVLFPVVLAGAHVRTYLGTQSLALTGSSQTLTVPAGATFADVYCEGASSTDYARFWHGGSTPTSSVGVKLKDHEVIQTADPATFRAINSSGTCTLRVEFYKYA
jgi:hypothetical protein